MLHRPRVQGSEPDDARVWKTSGPTQTSYSGIERHSYTFDVHREFPDALCFKGWEGGCAYKARRNGKPVVIIDESTMADFLNEDDPVDLEVMNRLVSIIEFNTETERDGYIAREMSFGVKFEK